MGSTSPQFITLKSKTINKKLTRHFFLLFTNTEYIILYFTRFRFKKSPNAYPLKVFFSDSQDVRLFIILDHLQVNIYIYNINFMEIISFALLRSERNLLQSNNFMEITFLTLLGSDYIILDHPQVKGFIKSFLEMTSLTLTRSKYVFYCREIPLMGSTFLTLLRSERNLPQNNKFYRKHFPYASGKRNVPCCKSITFIGSTFLTLLINATYSSTKKHLTSIGIMFISLLRSVTYPTATQYIIFMGSISLLPGSETYPIAQQYITLNTGRYHTYSLIIHCFLSCFQSETTILHLIKYSFH